MILRAVFCTLEVLSNHSSFYFSWDSAPMELGESMLPNQNIKQAYTSRKSSVMPSEAKKFSLSLHISVTAGEVERTILGTFDGRLDYCIGASCLADLGVGLDLAASETNNIRGKGELGLSQEVWEEMEVDVPPPCKQHHPPNGGKGVIVFPATSVKSLHKIVSLLLKPVNATSPSPIPIPEIALSDETDSASDAAMNTTLLLPKFINTSMMRFHGRRKGAQMRKPSMVEAMEVLQEYRDVSIVFVKVGGEFLPQVAQEIAKAFIEAVMGEDGVFQQYSGEICYTETSTDELKVDDKGQTILGVFGLPPWPQKKEQLAALKACHRFLQNIPKPIFDPSGAEIHVTVAVASGPILFSELGNEFRREASLLGDVVNIAARMLSIRGMDGKIVCDKYTLNGSEGQFEFAKLGDFTFKGKTEALGIWTATSLSQSSHINSPNVMVVGYHEEKEWIREAVTQWKSQKGFNAILIEAPSGLGKSNLIKLFSRTCTEKGIPFCLSQGSEVDQWTPYSGLRSMMAAIFQAVTDSKGNLGGGRSSSIQTALTATNSKVALALRRSSISANPTHSKTLRARRSFSALESQQHSLDQNRKLGEQELMALTFLKFFKEDLKLLPLLKTLMSLQIPDTQWSASLEGMQRGILIKNMVVRILIQWVRIGSGMAFIFDDAQWIDVSSLDVIQEVLLKCPEILTLICYRPITTASPEPLKKINELPSCKKSTLHGLTKDEAAEFLLLKLAKENVAGLDGSLLDLIHSRSTGSPLFLDFVSSSILEHLGDSFLVSSDGTLSPSIDIADAEAVLVADVRSGVKSQFDRLDADFQAFLRVASVFGQYFSLESVLAVSSIQPTVQDLQTLINQHDIFGFLNVKSVSDIQDTKTEYYFRHISITNAIYDGLSFSRRIELHTAIAEMLETIADEEMKREDLLPMIGFHYARSDKIVKKVEVLEELGFSYMQAYNCVGTFDVITMLITFVDSSRELIASSLPEKASKEILDNVRIGMWWSMIVESLAYRNLFSEALETSKTALSYLGMNFMDNPALLAKAFRRAFLRQMGLYIRTNGGARLLRKRQMRLLNGQSLPPGIPTMAETAKFSVFNSLLIVIIYDAGISPLLAGWIMFEVLNSLIPTAAARPIEWSRISIRTALILWYVSKPLAGMYLRSFQHVTPYGPDWPHADANAHSSLLVMKGDFEAGIRAICAYAEYWTSIGYEPNLLVAYASASEGRFLLGDLDAYIDKVMLYMDRAPQIDIFWAQMIPVRAGFRAFMKGDYDSATKYSQLGLEYSLVSPDIPAVRNSTTVQVFCRQKDKPANVDFLVYLQKMADAMELFDRPLFAAYLSIGTTIFAALFAQASLPDRNGDICPPLSQMFNESDRTAFAACLRKLEISTRRAAVQRKLNFMVSYYHMLKLCVEVFELGTPAKSWKKLKKHVENEGKTLLDLIVALKSFCFWALGTFANSVTDKRRYLKAAQYGFENMRASGVVCIIAIQMKECE
ncbi:hypothetical protein HDU97_004299 [Phlyctochytrium planicorne]|nr:hypothetical protein HDU97_004299 [Phlyctochytrium planicorne]